MLIRALIIALTLVVVSISSLHASDIARDVRAGRSARIDDSVTYGGYLELSTGLAFSDAPVLGHEKISIQADIGGHFRYKRFFVDALAESYNQAQFGYNFYSGSTWSIDWLAAVSDHGIDSELSKELAKYKERAPGLNMGLRSTAYSGPYILQFEAMQDISSLHDGYLLTAYVARNWLFHNWNLHALLGARFESDKALNYQYGLDASLATEDYDAYEAKSGTTYVTELGATHPLTPSLVFKVTMRRWELPTSVLNSPFVSDDGYTFLAVKLTYVY